MSKFMVTLYRECYVYAETEEEALEKAELGEYEIHSEFVGDGKIEELEDDTE